MRMLDAAIYDIIKKMVRFGQSKFDEGNRYNYDKRKEARIIGSCSRGKTG